VRDVAAHAVDAAVREVTEAEAVGQARDFVGNRDAAGRTGQLQAGIANAARVIDVRRRRPDADNVGGRRMVELDLNVVARDMVGLLGDTKGAFGFECNVLADLNASRTDQGLEAVFFAGLGVGVASADIDLALGGRVSSIGRSGTGDRGNGQGANDGVFENDVPPLINE